MLAGDIVAQVLNSRRAFEKKNPVEEQTPSHAIVRSVHDGPTNQACTNHKICVSIESGTIVPQTERAQAKGITEIGEICPGKSSNPCRGDLHSMYNDDSTTVPKGGTSQG